MSWCQSTRQSRVTALHLSYSLTKVLKAQLIMSEFKEIDPSLTATDVIVGPLL